MRTLFRGFGAFVGRVDSEERCAFWWQHPQDVNFDPILLVPVDLSRTPAAAAAGTIDWEEVQVDDHASHAAGGRTSIGPLWPSNAMAGAVYLADPYWRRLRDEIRPVVLPGGAAADAREYEFHTVVYWGVNGRTAARYYGFHGEIQSETGATAEVALYDAGRSKIDPPRFVKTIPLGALDQVDKHVDDGGLTEIGLGTARAKSGAIYLDSRVASSFALTYPKLPRALGH